MAKRPLHILFASPAHSPAHAFGGPVRMALTLTEGLARRGHRVEVITTTLLDQRRGRSLRSRTSDRNGVLVHYLATPLRYRWMGITPTLPLWLAGRRPDVVHVFGFRDVVTTTVAAWCRLRRIPYVFEPLGMFLPRVRKVRLKRLFDATVSRHVAAGAAAIVATSELERGQLIAAGAPADRIRIRSNGFPPPPPPPAGRLRASLGLAEEPLVLYVGRLASGKGVEMLLDAAARLPQAHVVFVGPDDGHGTAAVIDRAAAHGPAAGRVHRRAPSDRALELYGEADVFVLPSGGESFGMVAAEAAAAGAAIVVTDRCGVAELLADAALVVPYQSDEIAAAIGRLLDDPGLRARLGGAARAVASSLSWDVIVAQQEAIYHEALRRP
jgi:glycosyltransferase involved in cell wall biosynthesis